MLDTLFLRRYRATTQLGKGSVGTVYLARDAAKSEQVAVKVLHPHVVSDQSFRQFFDTKVKVALRLRHPCVAALLEAVYDGPNGLCLVSEYVAGKTLQELLQRHQVLPPERVSRLLIPLCRALTAGHALSIVHRALTPANLIVVDPDTDHESLKVMDFGAGLLNIRPLSAVEWLRNKTPGSAAGAPTYLAPDGLRGDHADHRSDIYSAGAILFEMLTGAPPFSFADAAATLNAHIKTPPPRFAAVRPLRIAPQIETVVRRCLEKYPKDRPQSAGVLADAFAAACGCPLTEQTFAAAERSLRPSSHQGLGGTASDSRFQIERSLETKVLEPIVLMKLRGFVSDRHGVVVDSYSGSLSAQLGVRAPVREPVAAIGGVRSWLAQKPAAPPAPVGDPIAITVQLTPRPEQRGVMQLRITFKPVPGHAPKDSARWQQSCDDLFHDLRSYLMEIPSAPGTDVDGRWR